MGQDSEANGSERARHVANQESDRMKNSPLSGGNIGVMRMSATHAIEMHIEALNRQLRGLHALLRALPREMPIEAEEALVGYLLNQRR